MFFVFFVFWEGGFFLYFLFFVIFIKVLVIFMVVFIRNVFYVLVGKKLYNMCLFLLFLLWFYDGYNENEIY